MPRSISCCIHGCNVLCGGVATLACSHLQLGSDLKEAGEAESEDDDEAIEVEDLHVMDLVEAFNTIIEAVDFNRMGDHEILSDDTPMELHAADIVDRLERHAEFDAAGMHLQTLFQGRRRVEMIGLFLATLELVRNRRVAVIQDEAGSIRLSLRAPETEASEDGAHRDESSSTAVSETDG